METRRTPEAQEQIRRFQSGLAGLRRRKRFVPYNEAPAYANKLSDLVARLDADGMDPRTGVELAAAFFSTDAAILEACDDSNGMIGDVFRFDARERFVHWAQRCDDKGWMVDIVFDLLSDDDYGVRDSVLDGAGTYLPEDALRNLADRMWEAAGAPVASDSEDFRDEFSRRHWLLLVELVARELNDADLFEQARRNSWPELGTAGITDIAEMRLSAGEPEAALHWLEQIGPDERFLSEKRDDLLREIYRELGRADDLEQLARRRFIAHRSESTLDGLVDVIGEQYRKSLIAEAADQIRKSDSLSLTDASFLINCGLVADAATYLVRHHEDIDGDNWSRLLRMAQHMTKVGFALAGTIIYRALLDSILDRRRSNAYGHGVRHLRTLDRLSDEIDDWAHVPRHSEYLERLREHHGRKTSFWNRYEKG